MTKIKAKFKIRWQLLLVILPIAIIPMILVVGFILRSNFIHLERQSSEFNQSLLNQVSINLDYMYTQYEMNLTDITLIDNFSKFIKAPRFNTPIEELSFQGKLNETETSHKGGTIWQKAMTLVHGDTCIVQSDRSSLLTDKDYTISYFSRRNFIVNHEKIINDPLFSELKSNKDKRIIFGKLQEGTINGFDADDRPVYIYPYYSEAGILSKFILVVLSNDFILNLYKHIKKLGLGTLYIIDQNNNLISTNHPSIEDNYIYNKKTGKYTFNKPTNNTDNFIDFNDFKLLNLNKNILILPEVRRILDNLTDKKLPNNKSANSRNYLLNDIKTIKYHNINYQVVVDYAEKSKCKLIFFQPVDIVRKSIYSLINFILFITLIVIILVSFVSFILSKSLTNPITLLSNIAEENSLGHVKLADINLENEIGVLAKTFNSMIIQIEKSKKILIEKKRMEKELEIAKMIQTALLPDLTIERTDDYRIDATMIPATEVGGDYYDLVTSKDGKTWYGIGDVTGHGLQSGLIMMIAQATASTIINQVPNLTPKDLIIKMNALMTKSIQERLKLNHYMTLSFLASDSEGNFEYAGAHLDLIIYRKKIGKCEILRTTGVWIGILPDISDKTDEASFHLEDGDVLVLFTDGIIEAMNNSKQLFDMSRLIDCVNKYYSQGTRGIINGIVQEVKKFMINQMDDMTLFVIMKKEKGKIIGSNYEKNNK